MQGLYEIISLITSGDCAFTELGFIFARNLDGDVLKTLVSEIYLEVLNKSDFNEVFGYIVSGETLSSDTIELIANYFSQKSKHSISHNNTFPLFLQGYSKELEILNIHNNIKNTFDFSKFKKLERIAVFNEQGFNECFYSAPNIATITISPSGEMIIDERLLSFKKLEDLILEGSITHRSSKIDQDIINLVLSHSNIRRLTLDNLDFTGSNITIPMNSKLNEIILKDCKGLTKIDLADIPPDIHIEVNIYNIHNNYNLEIVGEGKNKEVFFH